ncbi:MAG: MFS transporter [Candidatus Methanofastidiosia archaeon]
METIEMTSDSILKKRMLRYRWYILATISIIYFFVYLHRVSTGVICIEIQKTFAIGPTEFGVLGAAYFYIYALMQLPSGLLADRVGARKTITVSIFIAGIGTLLFGTAKDFSVLVVSRVFVGFGMAFVAVPTLKIISTWFRNREFATINGIWMAIGNMGAVAAMGPLAFLFTISGWRFAFIIISAITFILCVLNFIIVRDTPQDMGLPPLNENMKKESHNSTSLNNGHLFKSLEVIIKEKHFWIVTIWMCVIYGTIMGFQGLWAVPYLIERYGISKVMAANLISMFSMGIIFGCPIVGLLSDKVLKSRKKIILLGSALYALCWAMMVFVPTLIYIQIAPFFYFIMGFSASVFIMSGCVIKELFDKGITGTALGLGNTFTFLIAGVFMQIMSHIIEFSDTINGRYSLEAYNLSFLFCFISLIIVIMIILLLKETYIYDKEA